jgi:predicted signal transduction protein with EAL and GGDEF domain
VSRAEDPAVTAAKILDEVRKPYLIDEDELHITASIGIVAYPEDGTDVETLMKKADLAMYQVKDNGRDGYQFFNPEMNARAIEQQSLEDSLHYAIERQELVLHYQPKFSLVTGGIIGTEALIRWYHPQRGLVLPGKFITIAEECGLIVPLGRWVLRDACRQACAWQIAGLPPLCVAINISAVELRAKGFVSGVRAILKETGLAPQYLELELTETVLIEDSPAVAEVLKELKDIGVLLTLDDFGTGYSSLSHLKRFPIDALKIDQSFVRDLVMHESDASIVTAMIWIGKSLHIRVVAEGVETREQLEILQEHGCPQGQGNYFCPPMPAEEFRQLLERQTAPMAVARSTRRNGRGAARRLHSLMGA